MSRSRPSPPSALPKRRPHVPWICLAGWLPLLVTGCISRQSSEKPPPPFVFRALDLSYRLPNGRLAWELKAPQARYDLERRIAQAVDLRGVIYQKGKPVYRITARSGTVLNDGELIQLEGKPRIERLVGRSTTISGQRLRWIPGKQRIELEGEPTAEQQGLRITARQARFQLDADRLELRGSPMLRHWQKPPATARAPADLLVRVHQADWFPTSGQLRAPGPVVGERRLHPAPRVQTLTASSLEGNTEQRQLSLLAPVHFVDPSEDAEMRAQRTELDLAGEVIRSTAPFEARVGKSQAWGDAFVIDLQRRTGQIPQGCRLRQPTESLQADQCRWDWQQHRFSAHGAVELRRRDPEQLTRSTSLSGTLGPTGEALFSTPGGRVDSTLRLPSRPQGKPRQRRAIAL